MHRALLIHEVVIAIARGLSGSYCSADIAALARTCRAFCEPALDALWACPSDYHLAQTMSEKLWKNEELPLAYGGETKSVVVSTIYARFPHTY
jgi:hypothetical protein